MARIVPHLWFQDSLAEAGRLTAVLFQFPFSFHYTPENRRYLDRLLAELHELPRVVEFRNAEWLNTRVFDALRERGVGFCSVDAPQLKGLPASVDIVTSPLAYIRFHGRNEQTWWGSGAAARFDYRYNGDELKSWVGRIVSMLRGARVMRIYFNNHPPRAVSHECRNAQGAPWRGRDESPVEAASGTPGGAYQYRPLHVLGRGA